MNYHARPLRSGLAIGGALAAALAIGACGSSSGSSSGGSSSGSSSGKASSSQPGKGKPPVTIGDKNFTEEFILGQLYAQALQAKGYKINLKPNIGSSEVVDKALTSGQIQMYPEYTGVITTVIAGQDVDKSQSAKQTYRKAKQIEAKRGIAVLQPTPYQDADAAATKPAYAKMHHLKTIGDLKSVGHWTFGGPAENKTRYEGVVGLHKAYGLNNFSFVPLAEGINYQALDSGKIDVATVFTTDPQLLQKGKYTILADTKHIFGFQNAVPVVSQKTLKQEGPEFAKTVNKVSSLLTLHAIQQLNAAVGLQKQDPAKVASKFLQANGLK